VDLFKSGSVSAGSDPLGESREVMPVVRLGEDGDFESAIGSEWAASQAK